MSLCIRMVIHHSDVLYEMRRLPILFLLFITIAATGQEKLTINGTVKDASNGEALIGVTVYIKEISNGAVTNEYGFYSITLPKGTYSVDYTYVGFKPSILTVVLDKNIQQNIELQPESEQLQD
ncbi:MAG: carboxypeptidase-like regulatory domain-containing protein, partial [Cyclobacteriaceae bacterium]|nr:carboxypeptidase-like regulatory domain-containing protein [Cyclobacteriaceae bacterium]